MVCPFLTEGYQNSRNCEKELTYADSCKKDIVPCMAQSDFKASGWLGFLTAGMLWIDFRNPDNFETSMDSLVKEILTVCGDNIAQVSMRLRSNETRQLTTPKKGRAFIHIEAHKHLAETGLVKFQPASGSWNTLKMSEQPEDTCYWALESQDKGSGIVFLRNYVTQGYLGYDPDGDCVYTKAQHHGAEEWILSTDEADDTGKRAVIFFSNYYYGKIYLTVKNGKLCGVARKSKDCRWYLL